MLSIKLNTLITKCAVEVASICINRRLFSIHVFRIVLNFVGHTRQYSAGNLRPLRLWEEVVRLNCIASFRAHQRPITCLQCEGNRIVTASQDHTLKVHTIFVKRGKNGCTIYRSRCFFTLPGESGMGVMTERETFDKHKELQAI